MSLWPGCWVGVRVAIGRDNRDEEGESLGSDGVVESWLGDCRGWRSGERARSETG